MNGAIERPAFERRPKLTGPSSASDYGFAARLDRLAALARAGAFRQTVPQTRSLPGPKACHLRVVDA